jgi:predicted nucleic acid-binding protein
VFVAAGFNRESASARIVDHVRSGRLRIIWNEQTRRETAYIVRKIPPLSWDNVAEIFREENCHHGETSPEAFDYIPDADDRKFAALAEATGVALITNDDHLLDYRERTELKILTPREYLEQYSLHQ